MERLAKGLYGTEFQPTNYLFGISCGQKRRNFERIVQRAGWYNKVGEKLGWGDLSVADFIEMARGLDEREFFIIIPDGIFWPDQLDFGVVVAGCSHVVCGGRVYFIGEENLLKNPQQLAAVAKYGIRSYVVSREVIVILLEAEYLRMKMN